ncbi:MAG: hypothetical protein HY518_03275 [Candidatus Aenigmarchaeota archaeon]|nr:hypothetical protein [Candidatus Aenigmarchaeota archaeon]
MKVKSEDLERMMDVFISELKACLYAEDEDEKHSAGDLVESFYYEKKELLLRNTEASLKGDILPQPDEEIEGEDEP